MNARDLFAVKTKELGIDTKSKAFKELQKIQKKIDAYEEMSEKDVAEQARCKAIVDEYHSLENEIDENEKIVRAMAPTFKDGLIVVKKKLIAGKVMDAHEDKVDEIADAVSKLRDTLNKDIKKRMKELKPEYDVAIEWVRANNARFAAHKANANKEVNNG